MPKRPPEVSQLSPVPAREAEDDGVLFSPSPGAELDFPDALREVMAGRQVTKLEWNNPSLKVGLEGGFLSLVRPGQPAHALMVSDGDLFGRDWVVV